MTARRGVLRHLARAGVFLSTLAIVGCGGADGPSPNPIGPTPPPVVTPAPVASVTLDGPFTMETHTTKQLTVVMKDSTGATLTGRTVVFSSSDSAVVKVSSTGLATPVRSGSATIHAVSEGKSTSTAVTVVPMPGTVVIRVLTTDKTWGQETIPAWPNASPVKDTIAYSLYDLEIGRDGSGVPSYVSAYKFQDFEAVYPTLLADQVKVPAYMAASRLLRMEVAPAVTQEARSEALLASLKPLITEILEHERPTRIVLEYSGHGGPQVFFEGALTFADARELLKHIRLQGSGVPLILDFSTNCDVGYFDFVVHLHDVADYLLASERVYGGFEVGGVEMDDYLDTLHDRNLPRFWARENDIAKALELSTTNRQAFWQVVKSGVLAAKTEESLAVYDLSRFGPLMDALAHDSTFDPNGLDPYAYDIGNYAAKSTNSKVVEAFNAFRIRYVSTRDLMPWVTDTRGFSVSNPSLLADHLSGR